MTSRASPLHCFARLLARHCPGQSLQSCHADLLEGCNNKLKVLTSMAYGYRNSDYFVFKIRAGLSGIPIRF
jgi:hypothetical protein